jgi:putative FmdB family regulatory protein
MPIYEYKCWSCGGVFQELQPVSAPNQGTPCPKCGSIETTRIPSTFAGIGDGSADSGDCGGYGGFT